LTSLTLIVPNGHFEINTENLPILRSLFGIPFGGKNPFTAEVWFVNKTTPYNIDWETDSMSIHDTDYNTQLPLVSKGRYGLKITDAEKFLIKNRYCYFRNLPIFARY